MKMTGFQISFQKNGDDFYCSWLLNHEILKAPNPNATLRPGHMGRMKGL